MKKEEMVSIARVVEERKTNYIIRTIDREFVATIRGKFHVDGEFPKVGDYVEYAEGEKDQAVIENVLPRKNQIVRDASERSRKRAVPKPQVIATNVDVMFIVMGLDDDYSLARLERYLALAKESKVKPVIVLNKSDVVEDVSKYFSEVSAMAPRTPAHVVSARSGEGMDQLLTHLSAETTAVLLGSSGAGKSTITNWLLKQEKQLTKEVRESDGRGRHTTTSRELFNLPTGGYLIDTPGMRELGILSVPETTGESFEDIELLAKQCRYVNCDHEKSRNCALQEALQAGTIDKKRFENFLKLQKEQEYLKAKSDKDTYLERKQKVRRTNKENRKVQEQKYRGRKSR
jgi:ribosome biogenesis GTPase / thiamine phosphate phosphatase